MPRVGCAGRKEWVWEGAETVRAGPTEDVNIVYGALSFLDVNIVYSLLGGSLSINHSVVQIFGGLDLCFFHVSLLRQVFSMVLFRL